MFHYTLVLIKEFKGYLFAITQYISNWVYIKARLVRFYYTLTKVVER